MERDRIAQAKRWPGVAVAGVTALVSGVSIFVNSYGVKDFTSPAVFTTAKNAVAAVALVLVATVGARSHSRVAARRFVTHPDGVTPATPVGRWASLAYLGVVGGGLAFVLFFNGLALSQPAPAAFWRDLLVVWVALLAAFVLRERLRWWNLVAIGLLVVGEVTVTGGVGSLVANRGEVDVLLSSVLWALEVILAKRLLRDTAPATLALVRMGGGAVTLVIYLAATGSLRSLGSLDAHQWGWVLVTGALLAAYVATWMTALARARAVDVTAVLAAGAVLTWFLQWSSGATEPTRASLGLLLVVAGVTLVIVGATRARRRDVAVRT